jgi:hypothetical protein
MAARGLIDRSRTLRPTLQLPKTLLLTGAVAMEFRNSFVILASLWES